MKTNDCYYWADNWRLEMIERSRDLSEAYADTEYFLENTRGGKIILDKPVYDVLEYLAMTDTENTFEDIDRRKIVSSNLLEILLKAFLRIGVLSHYKISEKVPDVIDINLLPKYPLISIVIVNFNGYKHLQDLLWSLIQQTYCHLEIIIVDNRSTDNSCHWLKLHYPQIRLLELEKNTGFAAGVNTGIHASKGEYVLVLNNDIVLDINALYYLAEKALMLSLDAGTEKWAAVIPKMKFFKNPVFINALGNSFYPISWGSDNFIGSADFEQFDGFDDPMSACFGAVLINRQTWDKIGPLDKHYKYYYEDMDWCFRAHLQGYSIKTVPKSLIYHKFGASMSAKSQMFKLRFIVGNRLYFVLKNLESKTIRRFLRNYLIEDIKNVLIYLKRMNILQVIAYMWGYGRFFLSLPGLFFKRHKLQKQRLKSHVTDSDFLSRSVPMNTTFMEQGVPVMDVYSLRTNYAFLASGNEPDSPEPGSDIISWHLRLPRKNKHSQEKIYMEFSFNLAEPGNYNIHLLGLIKRNSDRTVYLDGQMINQTTNIDKNNKKFIMNFLAGENIDISQGRHILELGWRSQVYAVVLKKIMPPAARGSFREKPPLDPAKAF